MAQSSTKVEYMAAALAANHTLWPRKMLKDRGFKQNEGNVLWINNRSVIAIAQNPMYQGRTK